MSTTQHEVPRASTRAPGIGTPEWYALARPTSRYDRVMGPVFNHVIAAIMATVGWRVR